MSHLLPMQTIHYWYFYCTFSISLNTNLKPYWFGTKMKITKKRVEQWQNLIVGNHGALDRNFQTKILSSKNKIHRSFFLSGRKSGKYFFNVVKCGIFYSKYVISSLFYCYSGNKYTKRIRVSIYLDFSILLLRIPSITVVSYSTCINCLSNRY